MYRMCINLHEIQENPASSELTFLANVKLNIYVKTADSASIES